MEFSNRNVQPQAASPGAHTTATGSSSGGNSIGTIKKNRSDDEGKWTRIGLVVLAAAIAILLIFLIIFITKAGSSADEDKYVDSKKLQAVFLNTGQVYFGNIKTLNSKYFVVSNIYYLQTSGGNAASGGTNTNTNVSLVKLGCELHKPDDQMVINRAQVTFWENLHDNGQVAKAVVAFEKQNPQGQNCADQSSSASTNSTNNVQKAGNNNGSSTTPSTTNGGGSTTTPNTPAKP